MQKSREKEGVVVIVHVLIYTSNTFVWAVGIDDKLYKEL